MDDLREANVLRDAEWDASEVLDGSFFGNELAGEVGEAVEVGQAMVLGDEFAIDDLAAELADVFICIDLLALKFGLFIAEPPFTADPDFDTVQGLLDLAKFVGRACNITKKLERERLGLVGSRATLEDLTSELVSLLVSVRQLAVALGINLEVIVPTKFNKTSDKCGLTTMMVVPV